jgi:hypothetical protein
MTAVAARAIRSVSSNGCQNDVHRHSEMLVNALERQRFVAGDRGVHQASMLGVVNIAVCASTMPEH